MVENRKSYQKAEGFVGWKSKDGKLEVIGIAGKQGKITTYKVKCFVCAEDPQLFGDGVFTSLKGNLIKGMKPCGCSKQPKLEDWQQLLRSRRVGEEEGFIIHGFAEEFKGAKTKINLECLIDEYKWTASVDDIINKGSGCAKCSNKYKPTEQEALQKCVDICKQMDYDVIGFVNGYKGAHKTRFEYICKIHGKQNVSYNAFVNQGNQCRGCWKDKLKDLGNGNGYYPERKDEQDFIYVLNFNNQFIKVGRSFDVERRISELQRESGILDIQKLRIFTATHQEIYDLEQELHNELRERNFQHYVSWSTECFENESLFILNSLLDNCGLEEVK